MPSARAAVRPCPAGGPGWLRSAVPVSVDRRRERPAARPRRGCDRMARSHGRRRGELRKGRPAHPRPIARSGRATISPGIVSQASPRRISRHEHSRLRTDYSCFRHIRPRLRRDDDRGVRRRLRSRAGWAIAVFTARSRDREPVGVAFAENGAGGEDRTPDLRFTKPLHYRCATPAKRIFPGRIDVLAHPTRHEPRVACRVL